jgi:hypothetical protein
MATNYETLMKMTGAAYQLRGETLKKHVHSFFLPSFFFFLFRQVCSSGWLGTHHCFASISVVLGLQVHLHAKVTCSLFFLIYFFIVV